MNQGVPEGGCLPDQMTVRVHNLQDGSSWLEMPPPGSVLIGGKPFKVSDYQDIPIIIGDGRPVKPVTPTWWKRVKSRIYWKTSGVRCWIAEHIYPEGIEEDWW